MLVNSLREPLYFSSNCSIITSKDTLGFSKGRLTKIIGGFHNGKRTLRKNKTPR